MTPFLSFFPSPLSSDMQVSSQPQPPLENGPKFLDSVTIRAWKIGGTCTCVIGPTWDSRSRRSGMIPLPYLGANN